MSKLYKSIFNVNGCTVVKQEQTDTTVTITVRLTKGNASRCGCCGRKGKLYDNGREQRVWRTLDLGTKMGFIRMDTYRVKCKKCGVKTVKVPWASHRSGFTDAFEQQVAWAVCSMSKKAVAKQLRIAWNTVGETVRGQLPCRTVGDSAQTNHIPSAQIPQIDKDSVKSWLDTLDTRLKDFGQGTFQSPYSLTGKNLPDGIRLGVDIQTSIQLVHITTNPCNITYTDYPPALQSIPSAIYNNLQEPFQNDTTITWMLIYKNQYGTKDSMEVTTVFLGGKEE